MRKKLFYLIILVSLLGINSAIAQNKDELDSALYTWFDQHIGPVNSGVFTGTQYVEKHVLINEKHKFFKDVKFLKGSVNYNGQYYYDLQLKYNIHEDQLLLRHSDLIGTPTLILEKSKVTQFTIDNHTFNLLKSANRAIDVTTGFFEVLNSHELYIIYKKHKKNISSKSNQSFRYYEFKSNNSYVLYYQSEYHTLAKFNDLIKIFPEYKSEIKKLHQEFKGLYKIDPDVYFLKILNKIHTLLVDQNHSERS